MTKDLELKFILFITRRLPKIKGSRFLSKKMRKFYLRKTRKEVFVDVNGFKMNLQPGESVSNNACIFYPQLYDWQETDFLRKNLKDGDIFLDLGAHIGFYSFMASRFVGNNGKVISIEADPVSFKRFKNNVDINNIKNINLILAGVSDEKGIFRLSFHKKNRGQNSFLSNNAEGKEIQCYTLKNIIDNLDIKKIKGIKIDVEGLEFRVLKKFFTDFNIEMYPDFIITEFHADKIKESEGSVIDLIENNGYKKCFNTALNHVYKKKL